MSCSQDTRLAASIQTSRLLQLPLEIREQIYSYLLPRAGTVFIFQEPDPDWRESIPVLPMYRIRWGDDSDENPPPKKTARAVRFVRSPMQDLLKCQECPSRPPFYLPGQERNLPSQGCGLVEEESPCSEHRSYEKLPQGLLTACQQIHLETQNYLRSNDLVLPAGWSPWSALFCFGEGWQRSVRSLYLVGGGTIFRNRMRHWGHSFSDLVGRWIPRNQLKRNFPELRIITIVDIHKCIHRHSPALNELIPHFLDLKRQCGIEIALQVDMKLDKTHNCGWSKERSEKEHEKILIEISSWDKHTAEAQMKNSTWIFDGGIDISLEMKKCARRDSMWYFKQVRIKPQVARQ